MLALQYYRDGLCPICGRPADVCQNAENEMKWTSPTPARCHATTAIKRRQEAQSGGQTKAPHPEALLYRAELKP